MKSPHPKNDGLLIIYYITLPVYASLILICVNCRVRFIIYKRAEHMRNLWNRTLSVLGFLVIFAHGLSEEGMG